MGNVINDIYLRLDEQKNNFEQDEAGRYWLDVCFDEQTYPYFRRTSVYSGAAVSMEVLAKFGHDVEISGVEARVDENGFSLSATPKNFRYIISRGSEAAYLTSEERGESKFFSPLRRIDWIFVDRSAEISSKVAQEIVAFLAIASHVKLAVYATSEMTLPLKLLADRADLVFVDNDEYTPSTEQNACYISDSMIKLNIKGEKPITGRSVSSVEDLCSQLNESQIYYNYGFNADKSAVTIKDTIYIKNLSIDNIQDLICELGVSLNSVAHLASGKDGNASV